MRPSSSTVHSSPGQVHVGRDQLDPLALRLVRQRVGRVEAHRLLVEQRAQELRPVVHAQPGRLVGEQPEGGPVRLGEAEAREADDHRVHALGRLRVGPVRARGALDEALVVGLDRRRRALAAHRPAQPLRLARREARERHRDLDHLVLEDDRAERVAQHRLQRRVVVGDLEVRVLAHPLAARDVRVDRPAEDRPGPHDRDLDREVVQRLGPRAIQRLHLRAALDLEDAHRVGRLDRRVGRGVVERDPREVDALAARARDQLDRALDAGEHPQPEQVDLQEARVRAGVLVPLAQLAPLHRRRQHRAAVDQRPGRDDHPARVLGEVARQPVGLVAQPRQPRPAAGQRRAAALVGGALLVAVGPAAVDHRMPLGGRHRERPARVRVDHRRRRPAGLQPERRLDIGGHAAHRPRLGPARDALELTRRQPEHLAQLADRPARAERRERGHQRRALAPVAVVDARDQDLADVAREVEVDVGQRGQLLVEEAPEEQVVGDRVDVREAGEVADDRGHRGAAPAPRRQQRARRVGAAHLHRDLARQLQQVAVQDEEAGQPEPVDHAQLLLQPGVRGRAVRAAVRVALGDQRPAQLGQRADRGRVLRARVAVAEIDREVEAQPLGERGRLGHRPRVVLEARRHRLRGSQHVRGVAAAQRLRRIERRVVAQGDERVLQRRARERVRVDVAGRHRRHAQPLGQPGEPAVARAVVALERPLQLDAQVLAPEGGQQPPQRRLVVHALARAPAQADEPGGVLLERLQRHGRRRLAVIARVGVRAGEDATEAAPALLRVDQQREVAAVVEVDLRPVDRLQPEPLGGLCELHRAAQPVVVGQREGAVAQLGRRAGQLLGQRGAVEEGEGGVGVQLGVHGCEHMFACRRRKDRRPGGDMVLQRVAGSSDGRSSTWAG